MSADERSTRRTSKPSEPRAANEELNLEQATLLLNVLHAQISAVRASFFRLCQLRAADMVTYQNHSWDRGAEYINREMTGLDAVLSQLAPPEVQHGPAN